MTGYFYFITTLINDKPRHAPAGDPAKLTSTADFTVTRAQMIKAFIAAYPEFAPCGHKLSDYRERDGAFKVIEDAWLGSTSRPDNIPRHLDQRIIGAYI